MSLAHLHSLLPQGEEGIRVDDGVLASVMQVNGATAVQDSFLLIKQTEVWVALRYIWGKPCTFFSTNLRPDMLNQSFFVLVGFSDFGVRQHGGVNWY